MRPKISGMDLPPRMLRRKKSLKSGRLWVGYYYNGRDENGRRTEIALGCDLIEAKRKWAEFECRPAPSDSTLMRQIFDRYEHDVLPTNAVPTQVNKLYALSNFRKVFADVPIDSINVEHIIDYHAYRSKEAPVTANRELAVLSHVFKKARNWKYTSKPNPCEGIEKNREKPRDYYVENDVWHAVFEFAPEELRHAMLLAYLSGQRMTDVMQISRGHIKNDMLHVRQSKTSQRLRIELNHDNGERTQLGHLLDDLVDRAARMGQQQLLLLPNGELLTRSKLRIRFEKARAAAASTARNEGNPELAERIEKFWFRDIRPKAATDIDDLTHASMLLGHTNRRITKRIYRRAGEKVKPTR